MNSSPPRRARRLLLTGAAATLAAVAAGPAQAQTANPKCADLALVNPVYGDGGTAALQYIGKLATVLAGLPQPTTVVFRGSGGCAAIYGLLQPTTLTGTATYWTSDGVAHKCDLPATGVVQQFGNMVNSALLCPDAPAPLPNTIGDVEGPVTAVNFIANKSSTETSISSEAAYLVYGFGGASNAVAPWTTESLLFKRNQNSAVGLYVGLAIGVTPNQQKGTLISDQTMAINGVANAATPAAALGYVSSDAADNARATVKTLAYQHKNQICGYLPDSTGTSFDKRNVRDGHYWLWGAQHWFGAIDATSKAFTDPNVAKLVGLSIGTVAPPAGVDVNTLAIQTGNVPRCAMTVWRDGDLGEFYSYAPTEPCACFFEKTVPGGATTCKACATNDECASVSAQAKCRNNLCEAY